MSNRLPLVLSSAALAVAVLGATPLGEAASGLVVPRNSIGTGEVRDRSLLARDFKPGQLPRGPQGPAGPAGPAGTIEGVAAGGDLTGAYPSPVVAGDALTGAEVADGSLRLGDTAVLSGQVRVDLPRLGAHSCVARNAAVVGLEPYDRTLVLPTQNLPTGLFVTQVFNTNAPGRVLFRVCNATAKPLDAPLGAWAYVVWRP